MKKTFLIVIGLCLTLTACDEWREHDARVETITVNGKTHEYLIYVEDFVNNVVGGITHFPDCKYCTTDSVDFSGYNTNGDSDYGV